MILQDTVILCDNDALWFWKNIKKDIIYFHIPFFNEGQICRMINDYVPYKSIIC